MVSRKITGRQPKWQVDGSWEYLPLETEIQEAGFEEIGEYVLKRENTFVQYIVMQPITGIYKETVWIPGVRVAKIWW